MKWNGEVEEGRKKRCILWHCQYDVLTLQNRTPPLTQKIWLSTVVLTKIKISASPGKKRFHVWGGKMLGWSTNYTMSKWIQLHHSVEHWAPWSTVLTNAIFPD